MQFILANVAQLAQLLNISSRFVTAALAVEQVSELTKRRGSLGGEVQHLPVAPFRFVILLELQTPIGRLAQGGQPRLGMIDGDSIQQVDGTSKVSGIGLDASQTEQDFHITGIYQQQFFQFVGSGGVSLLLEQLFRLGNDRFPIKSVR
jgi:hypothetical protein